MDGVLKDIRYAMRQLGKSPGYSLTALLMLALGICANSTILSWISATLLNPIPTVRRTSDLMAITRGARSDNPMPPFSYLDYEDMKGSNRSLAGILAYQDSWMTLTGAEKPTRVFGVLASSNYFEVLGVKPRMGRFFLPDEENIVSPFVVISHALWQTQFSGDPGIVGRALEVNRHLFTIIGVAPEGFVGCKKLEEELCAFVADRLTHYKQPREVRFVDAVPKTASGKILRRELRKLS